MTELQDFARNELELIGESENNIDAYLLVVSAFEDLLQLSGESQMYAAHIIDKLLKRENLTPLTDNLDEWVNQSSIFGVPVWQNKRNPEAFSNDNGKTYYLASQTEWRGGRNVKVVYDSKEV